MMLNFLKAEVRTNLLLWAIIKTWLQVDKISWLREVSKYDKSTDSSKQT